jgi:hypothetical protein
MVSPIATAVSGIVFSLSTAGIAAAQDGSAGHRLNHIQKRHLSGFASMAIETASAKSASTARGSLAKAGATDPADADNYTPSDNKNCDDKAGSNVKVNQNCVNLTDPDLQGRAQSQNEGSIAQDPNAPHHLVASYNDYRRGDGTCGISWSTNGGNTWQDSTVPNSFVRGTAFDGVARQYFHSGGDTSVAWTARATSICRARCSCAERRRATTPRIQRALCVQVHRQLRRIVEFSGASRRRVERRRRSRQRTARQAADDRRQRE